MKKVLMALAATAFTSLSACGTITLQNGNLSFEVGMEDSGITAGFSGTIDINPSILTPDANDEGRETDTDNSSTKALKSTKTLTADQASVLKLIEEKALKHQIDPTTLAAVGWIESRFRNVKNPNSTAKGVMQFINSTAKLYGLLDPYDISANVDAGARLMDDNRRYLRKMLEREPEGWMLYLAHQQGAAGAVRLLSATTVPARDIVGQAAVTLNTNGSADASASVFVKEWRAKFERARSLFSYD
ncbi:MAG: transglycosylase SLT domain-containing protein [Pseudomonadota bacterium]